MQAIEPNWVASLAFAALATGCAVAVLILAGMFPLRARPDAARSNLALLLVAANALLLALLLAGTGFYGVTELRWTTLIVLGGLVALFAPGLFEALPERLRDGRAGLAALAGVQAIGLALLAKAGGFAWTNISWATISCPTIPGPPCRNQRDRTMPFRIKFALSLLVVLATAIAAYWQNALGHDRLQYVVAFLGAFMIFSMWLFPEVKREESAGGVRDTAGR